jgi:hypothetical protein
LWMVEGRKGRHLWEVNRSLTPYVGDLRYGHL